MVKINPGRFTMGCTDGQGRDCERRERPAHPVQLTHDYLLGRYEVSQGMWLSVMGDNPSQFLNCGSRCPVEQITWFDAIRFANALSEREGLVPCYEIEEESIEWPSGLDCEGYRLPTEAEWEYAVRAGDDLKFAGSDSSFWVAWFRDNSGERTHPSGQRLANGHGLEDLSGNVWEWCWDSYAPYSAAAQTDPLGRGSGENRVIRGGSWDNAESNIRTTYRGKAWPHLKRDFIGLRLARTLP